jgi:hypothetical protein
MRWSEISSSLIRCPEFEFSPKNAAMLNSLEGELCHPWQSYPAVAHRGYPVHTKNKNHSSKRKKIYET